MSEVLVHVCPCFGPEVRSAEHHGGGTIVEQRCSPLEARDKRERAEESGIGKSF